MSQEQYQIRLDAHKDCDWTGWFSGLKTEAVIAPKIAQIIGRDLEKVAIYAGHSKTRIPLNKRNAIIRAALQYAALRFP